jgi:hypothetical protein
MSEKAAVQTEELNKALDQLETLVKGCGSDDKSVTKGDEGDDKDPTYREDEGKEDEKEDTEDGADKSFAASIEDSESIKKGLEVSEFLNDLVSLVSASVDGVRGQVVKGFKHQDDVNSTIAKSMTTIAKSISAMAESVKEVVGRMDELEKQPATVKKSITAVGVERRFVEDEQKTTMSKAMISQKLNDAVMKGEVIGGCTVTAHDAIKFESTGQLRPDLKLAVLGQ